MDRIVKWLIWLPLLTGCTGLMRQDIQEWQVTLDVIHNPDGGCTVNFVGGENVKVIDRDLSINPRN